MSTRMLPPTFGPQSISPITLASGRSYSPSAASYQDVNDSDANVLEANFWTRVSLVGTTAQRPASPGNTQTLRGTRYVDTSTSTLLIHDGIVWRVPETGAPG